MRQGKYKHTKAAKRKGLLFRKQPLCYTDQLILFGSFRYYFRFIRPFIIGYSQSGQVFTIPASYPRGAATAPVPASFMLSNNVNPV